MSRFTLPRDIYHGPGSLSEIAKLKGKKAFVVTGRIDEALRIPRKNARIPA